MCVRAWRLAHLIEPNVFAFGLNVNFYVAFAAVAVMSIGQTANADEGSLYRSPVDQVDASVTADCATLAGQRTTAPQMMTISASTGPCIQPRETPRSASAQDPDPSPADAKAFGLKATLYITTDRDSGRDSIGCSVVPMRTVAVDGHKVKRHSVLFIKETVGLPMPDGSVHDGYWYATDVGSAIHVGRVDLYTGKGIATIKPLLHLNLKTLTVTTVGQFAGCPTRDGAPTLPST